ncbi:MAG TPA: septum formation family protein [Kineosporiaceae bacterium]|nr:septum formation family protein [Kineosporiaceae bacterium]
MSGDKGPDPQDPWAQGAPDPWAPPPRNEYPPLPRDGVSVAGFVTGLLGLVLVAVGLSIAGLARTAHGRRRGRGFAVAGLLLSVAWVAVGAVVVSTLLRSPTTTTVAVADVPSPTSTASPAMPTPTPSVSSSTRRRTTPAPRPVPPRKLYVDQLRTGTCLVVGLLGDSVLKVPVVPCRQSHDAEVVGVTQLPGRWHGEAALEKLADRTCARLFRSYVGVDVDSSHHGYGWFGPTADSWKHGDRLVVCMAEEDGAHLTGSVKGTSA